VMISDVREYYDLVNLFSQFEIQNLRLVMGVPSLKKILDTKYYSNLKGGIFEAMSMLLPTNTKLYVYPTLDGKNDQLITSKDIQLESDIEPLYQYLQINRFIVDLESHMSDQLRVKSYEVIEMIETGDKNWEKYVPMAIANMIKEKRLFGFGG